MRSAGSAHEHEGTCEQEPEYANADYDRIKDGGGRAVEVIDERVRRLNQRSDDGKHRQHCEAECNDRGMGELHAARLVKWKRMRALGNVTSRRMVKCGAKASRKAFSVR